MKTEREDSTVEIFIKSLFLPVYISLSIPVIVFTIQVFLLYPIIRILSGKSQSPFKQSADFAKWIYKL